jgi:hypothetical protein
MNLAQGRTLSHYRGLKAVVIAKRKQKEVISRGRTQAIDKARKKAYHEGPNLGSLRLRSDRNVRVLCDQDLSGAELI